MFLVHAVAVIVLCSAVQPVYSVRRTQYISMQGMLGMGYHTLHVLKNLPHRVSIVQMTINNISYMFESVN